ncbi:MAG: hypothetical protein ORN58_06265, partial [Sediminibacterium sp.]|nr:hypothetical protein [Sediminibacterium sp.]
QSVAQQSIAQQSVAPQSFAFNFTRKKTLMRSEMFYKVLRKGGIVSFSFVLLMNVNGVFAQNEDDALRFSNTFGAYSNRALGMGGAYTALGADFTNFFQNPAGLAAYKKKTMEK